MARPMSSSSYHGTEETGIRPSNTAVASSGFILEYSLGANPMLHDLVEEDFPVVDGQIEIPDRPGLGLTLDDGFVERYRVR